MKSKHMSYLLSFLIAFNPLIVSAAQFPNIIRVSSPVYDKGAVGENWIAAAPVFSDWTSGAAYDCSSWLPDPSTYTEPEEFEQSASDCSVDQTRTRQNREIETRTGKYRDAGAPILEEVTYTSQSATRDYRISYSTWSDEGSAYGCNNWTPDPGTYPAGAVFTQTASDCELNQAQTRSEFSRFENGSWVGEGNQSFTRTLTDQASTRQSTGSADLPTIALNTPATQVFAGESFDLSWSSNGTVQLRADHANSGIATTDFDVTGSSYSVTPTVAGTFTYTATARNAANQQSSAARTVTAINGPAIASLNTDKVRVAINGLFTLSWSTSHADTLSINNGIGEVTGTSALITVGDQPGTQTYTLTASKTLNGIEKVADRSIQVEVVAAPTLNIISAPATSVFVNAPFSLSWAGTDVASYAIRGNVAASGLAVTDLNLNAETNRTITPTAPGTYTYTLTGTNSVGELRSVTHAVMVVGNPAISSFTSDSSTITAGGNATLSWSTAGSSSLSIDQGVGAVTGTSKVVAVGTITGNKTYTLTSTSTLNGVTRTANQNLSINVVDTPAVSINTAPATNVFANTAFTLGWSATGATNYKIRGNVAASGVAITDVDMGTTATLPITPTAAGTYTYTVTATNAAGTTTTATRVITVVADPVVSAFTATPTSVSAGGNTTLAWTTTGATTLAVDQSVGVVTGTSTTVAVGATAGAKTYTLTASSTLNSVTRSDTATATVTVVAAPTLSINTAPSTNVFANAAFTLGWSATGATNYKIRGNIAASGVAISDVNLSTGTSRAITPTAVGTYTYTVTATNSLGITTTATKSITVVADPVVPVFTATPSNVTAGGNATLDWVTTGASDLSINHSVGEVTGTSKVVNPGTATGNKTYTLTASSTLNGVTRSGTKAVTVSVFPAPTVVINSAPSTNVFANTAFTLGWTGTSAANYKIRGNVAASGVATTDVDMGTTATRSITPTAVGTYTYTLTVTNAAGATTTTTRSITVAADPVISEFAATPEDVTVGGSTTLAWTTTGTALSINQSVGSVTGSTKVIAVGSTVGAKFYTLTASTTLNGVTRSDVLTATVLVVAAPTLSITSSPSTSVFANTAFTLQWSTSGASGFSIRGNVAASGVPTTDTYLWADGSKVITPTAPGTYTYTVSAHNTAGSTTTVTKTVTVVADPAVSTFTATPASVTAGGNTTLAWTTAGATSLSINQSVGAVTGTSTVVAVGSTTGAKTYTLTASTTLNGVTRSKTASATVTVIAAPTVAISAAPSTNVFSGEAFALGWTGTGATNYKIRGNVAASGVATTDVDVATATSRVITPTAAGTYTYTVTATNTLGVSTTTTRSVTAVNIPSVTGFSASPSSVALGGNTTLSWTTTGATSLSIDQGVGGVSGSSVSVAVGTAVGNRTYTLTASATLNGITRTATRSATATVVASCGYSFNANGDASAWKFFADGNAVWTGNMIPGSTSMWFAVSDLRIPFSDPVQYYSGMSKVSNTEFRYNTGARVWRIYRGAYIGNTDGFVMYQLCIE